jgi:hypothetical protein
LRDLLPVEENIQMYMKEIWFQDVTGKGKGKAIPLQALTSPEGSRSLNLPDFKTICT